MKQYAAISDSPASLLAPYVEIGTSGPQSSSTSVSPMVAVDAAPGRVQDPPDARPAHRLDDVVREERALVEVDARLGRGARDVRVRREVDDDVVPGCRVDEGVEVGDVGRGRPSSRGSSRTASRCASRPDEKLS